MPAVSSSAVVRVLVPTLLALLVCASAARADGPVPVFDHALVPVGDRPTDLVHGDFDDDGRPDLVVGHDDPDPADGAPPVVRWLRGNGTGAFTVDAPNELAELAGEIDLGVGDVDADGDDDLVVAGDASSNVVVLRGTPAGLAPADAAVAVGLRPGAIAVGDLDGDDRADAAVLAEGGDPRPLALLQAGVDGDLALRPEGQMACVGMLPPAVPVGDVDIADFDGDGRADVLVQCPGVAEVWLGDGDGGITLGAAGPSGAGWELDVADLNEDGLNDLAALGNNPLVAEQSRVAIVAQTAAHGLAAPSSTNNDASGTATGLTTGDVNGDDHVDVAVVAMGLAAGNLLVGLGDGNGQLLGRFDRWWSHEFALTAGGSNTPASHTPVVADLTGDGRTDVAAPVPNADGVDILRNVTPGQPAAFTHEPSGISGTAATFEGAYDGAGQPVRYRFEYGPAGGGDGTLRQTAPVDATGAGEVPVTLRVEDLEPVTTYRVRLRVENVAAGASTVGRFVEFETLPAPPVNTSAPVISGTPRVGETLTCAPGSWTGATSYAYRWVRNGSPIGATGETYVPTGDDADRALQCNVTATGPGGTTSAFSVPVVVAEAPVTPPPALIAPPMISGTPRVGETLLCDPGTWTGATGLAYRWLRNGTPIGEATDKGHVATDDDAGTALQCEITATGPGGQTAASSAPVVVEPAAAMDPPENTTPPSIAGTPAVGATLTCDPGTWSEQPTFEYRWVRDGDEIDGATGATYVPAGTDAGRALQCRVTATGDGGSTTAFSAPVVVAGAAAPNPPSATVPPTISGTARAGETLTCAPGTWTGATAFSYRWLRDGAPIGGSVAATHAATGADVHHALQCRVTASGPGGETSATSAPIVVAPAPIAPPWPPVEPPAEERGDQPPQDPPPAEPQRAPASRVAPTIDGTPLVGETVTCRPGEWTDAGEHAYRWLRNGAPIASGQTYALRRADRAKAVQCVVTARGAGGSVDAHTRAVVVAQRCVVLQLRGRKLRAARKALRRHGCRAGEVTRQASADVRKGRVLRSAPPAERVADPGTEVTLVVSRGPARRR